MVNNLSFYINTDVPITCPSEDKTYWYCDTGITGCSPWPHGGWSSSIAHLPQVYRYLFPTRVYLVTENPKHNAYMGVSIYDAKTNKKIDYRYEHESTIKDFLYSTEKEAQEAMKCSLARLKTHHEDTVGKSLKKIESSLKALKPYV